MFRIVFLSAVLGAALAPLFAFAFEATSTSFKLIDPVFTVTGGFATSTTYRLNETAAKPAIATSSSLTSFRVSAGFLYFPFVTKPTVSATAGDGSVALSWTASQGFFGWTVSGYNVGQAIVSGGPYAYSASLGNVLSLTKGSLSNGTTYYFVVRADVSGNNFGNKMTLALSASNTTTRWQTSNQIITPTGTVTAATQRNRYSHRRRTGQGGGSPVPFVPSFA